MARWAAERSFDGPIFAAADRYGIRRSLALGLAAEESAFQPDAFHAGEESFGLYQVRLATAQALGYTGAADGLFDPATNADLGLHYLHDQLARAAGDERAAVSAYNGGWRPDQGFGAPRADGTFANEAYVEKVLGNAQYFALQGVDAAAPAAPQLAGVGFQGGSVVAVALVVILVLVALAQRRAGAPA